MAPAIQPDRQEKYLEAIRRQVCGRCLDARDDGSCGLGGRQCAIEAHLPALLEAILAIESTRMDDYVTAIEAQVCRSCDAQDTRGLCGLREEGLCALYTYLPLVVDAVRDLREDEVRMADAR